MSLLISKPMLGFIMLLLTAAMVAFFFPSISAIGDQMSTIALTSAASEIASAATAMQESSDGSHYEFQLSNIRGCQLKIFPEFVELKNAQKTIRAPVASPMQGSGIEAWNQYENCFEKPVMKFRKENGKVIVEVGKVEE